MRRNAGVYLVVALAASMAAACTGEKNAPPATPPGSEEPGPTSRAAITPPRRAGEVVIQLAADDERVKVGVGERSGGLVRASGTGGALVFGPYVPMDKGSYTLLVEGSSSGPFSVDVTHSAGTVRIAAGEYPAAAASPDASLASLDFEVADAVEGVEFRVIVADGTDATVGSYKVVTR